MYVRKVRRRCGVRNCKSLESYAISRTREAGNSVIICRDCLEEALKMIDEGKLGIPARTSTPTEAPPLFFNTAIAEQRRAASREAENMIKAAENDKIAPENSANVTKMSKNSAFVCDSCGRTFDTAAGLKRHKCRKAGADE